MVGRLRLFLCSWVVKSVVTCVTLLGVVACGFDVAGDDVSMWDSPGIIGTDIEPSYKVASSPVHSFVFLGEDRGAGISLCGGLVVGRRFILTARHCSKRTSFEMWASFPKGDQAIDNKETFFSKNVKRIKVVERLLPNQVQLASGRSFAVSTDMEPGAPVLDILLLRLAEDVPADVPIFDITKIATDKDVQGGRLVAFGYNTEQSAETGIMKGFNIHLKRAINTKGKVELPKFKVLQAALAQSSCFGDTVYECDKGERVRRYGDSVNDLKLFTNFGNGLCEGDSGSPLFVLTAKNEFKLLGVTSEVFAPQGWTKIRETRCAGYAAFQNVNPVRAWLEQELK